MHVIYNCSTNICEGVNSLTWTVYADKNTFEPTSGGSHMRMAQCHFQEGKGEATLGIQEELHISDTSPENKKRLREKDKRQKK